MQRLRCSPIQLQRIENRPTFPERFRIASKKTTGDALEAAWCGAVYRGRRHGHRDPARKPSSSLDHRTEEIGAWVPLEVRREVTPPSPSDGLRLAQQPSDSIARRRRPVGSLLAIVAPNRSVRRYRSPMRHIAALVTAVAFSGPAVALACSPFWSLERHSPTATSTVPSNAVFQIIGPLRPLSIEVGEVGQPLSSPTVTEVPDQSLWSLSNVVQFSLPQVSPGASIRVVVSDTIETIDLVLTPTTADTTPPVFAGPPSSATAQHVPATPGTSACIPPEHFEVWVDNPGATDDFEIANYTLIETTGGAVRTLSSYHPSVGHSPASLRGYIPAVPGRHCFAVIARDLAGNETTSAEVCEDFALASIDAGIVDSCAPAADAAGASPPLDAGTGAPDAGAQPIGAAADGGCTCVPVDPRAVPGGLLMLGLLALRRRRQR